MSAECTRTCAECGCHDRFDEAVRLSEDLWRQFLCVALIAAGALVALVVVVA